MKFDGFPIYKDDPRRDLGAYKPNKWFVVVVSSHVFEDSLYYYNHADSLSVRQYGMGYLGTLKLKSVVQECSVQVLRLRNPAAAPMMRLPHLFDSRFLGASHFQNSPLTPLSMG